MYLGVRLSHNFKLEVSYSTYARKQEKRQELFIEDSAQLYLSFVRPHLKYASPMWDPYCSSHKDILEKTFVLHISYRTWKDIPP